MEIDKLLDEIVEDAIIGRDFLGWNKNEIIRYVYIKLGQNINKSVDFFYSSENKFKEQDKLSEEEMERIQEADASYDVTCKVTAKMLIYMLKKLDIKAKLMQTCESQEYKQTSNSNNKFDIYHYFVCCTGEEDKEYFLTLNADLTNIKMGFPTSHFGNSIGYYTWDNENDTYKLDENGNKIPYYMGEEINFSTMKKNELEKIDKKIGYLTKIGDNEYQYVPNLKEIKKKIADEKYIDALVEKDEQGFYAGFQQIFSKLGKENYSELSSEEVFQVHQYILLQCLKIIEKKINTSFDSELVEEMSLLTKQKKYSEVYEILKEFIKSKTIKNQNINGEELFGNPIAISNHMIKLMNTIDILKKEPSQKNATMYRTNLNKLSRFFIPQSKLRKKGENKVKEKYSNEYVYRKIKTMLIKDFDCTIDEKIGSKTNYNKMGLLEQQIFLRLYLKKIMGREFSEDEFQDRVIIAGATLQENKNEYHFLILISNKDDAYEHVYMLDYDPKRNIILDDVSLFDIYYKYKILSDTMDTRLEEIETNGRKR